MSDADFTKYSFSCNGFGFSPEDTLVMMNGDKRGLTTGIRMMCDLMENSKEDYKEYNKNRGGIIMASVMAALAFVERKKIINLSNPDLCPIKGIVKGTVLNEILPRAKEELIRMEGKEAFEAMKAKWEAVEVASLDDGMELIQHFVKNDEKRSLLQKAVEGMKSLKEAMKMSDEAPKEDEDEDKEERIKGVTYFQFGDFGFHKDDVVMAIRPEKVRGVQANEIYSPLSRMLRPYDTGFAHKNFKKALKRDELSQCVLGSLMGNLDFTHQKVINLTSPELSTLPNSEHAREVVAVFSDEEAMEGFKRGLHFTDARIAATKAKWDAILEEVEARENPTDTDDEDEDAIPA